MAVHTLEASAVAGSLGFWPGEDIDDFSHRFASLMQNLEMFVNDNINEERAVKKLLCIILDKYTYIALVVEMILYLSVLTIEEVMGHLIAFDDCKLSPIEPTTTGGKLLLIEEQWHARQGERKKRDASGSSSGRARQPRKKDKGKAPRPRGGDSGSGDSEHKANMEDTCHSCGRVGH